MPHDTQDRFIPFATGLRIMTLADPVDQKPHVIRGPGILLPDNPVASFALPTDEQSIISGHNHELLRFGQEAP